MDFKIAINCGSCKSKFEISNEFPKDKDALECPCCNAQFPKEHWENLKSGLISLGSVPNRIEITENKMSVFQLSLVPKFRG